MNKFYNISGFISGIVGGFVLLLFFFPLHSSFILSLICGVVGFTGTYTTLYAFKPKDQLNIDLGGRVNSADLNRTLKQGEDQVKQLQYFSSQLNDPTVKAKLTAITDVIQDIFMIFKKDPRDIKKARPFLSYYLDTTITIVRKYVDLSAQHINSPEMKMTLLKAENMLGSIAIAFEKQKEKLLSDDVMDLDVEIQTLEKNV